MKIKTAELTHIALNYAVATLEYPHLVWGKTIGIHAHSHQLSIPEFKIPDCFYNPSTNWAQGGPIIEREDISFRKYYNKESAKHGIYYAKVCRESGSLVSWSNKRDFTGETPLIAAMRCYVASKLGDEVDIPKELINAT